jgi:uncharacterized protein (TIGR02145 family)
MKACPSGWHLPSKEEWDALSNSVGGSKTEGKYLKAKGGWNSNKGKSGNGLDTYGFAALPGGHVYPADGSFRSAGLIGSWWSASEDVSSLAYYKLMGYSIEGAGLSTSGKNYLFSVRCLQD